LEIYNEGFDRRSCRRVLNDATRRSSSAVGIVEAAGVFGKMTVPLDQYPFEQRRERINQPPSRMRYKFLRSSFSLLLSPSSFNLAASPLSTALATLSVLPCNTSPWAKLLEGSGMSKLCCREKGLRFSRSLGLLEEGLTPASAWRSSEAAIAWSACSLFQNQTKPVPRERPESGSRVMRA
jgi:hypothetical protein